MDSKHDKTGVERQLRDAPAITTQRDAAIRDFTLRLSNPGHWEFLVLRSAVASRDLSARRIAVNGFPKSHVSRMSILSVSKNN
jgi:hypothetical protein